MTFEHRCDEKRLAIGPAAKEILGLEKRRKTG
jgi:hypothetical protein